MTLFLQVDLVPTRKIKRKKHNTMRCREVILKSPGTQCNTYSTYQSCNSHMLLDKLTTGFLYHNSMTFYPSNYIHSHY